MAANEKEVSAEQETEGTADPVLDIPELCDDILLCIGEADNLKWKDVLRLSLVSRAFYEGFSRDLLWKKFLASITRYSEQEIIDKFPGQVKNKFIEIMEKHLEIFSREGFQLESMAREYPVLGAEYRLVLAAVSQNGAMLRHAAQELKANFSIVKAAVSETSCALELAAQELQDDETLKNIAEKRSAEQEAEVLRGEDESIMSDPAPAPSHFQFFPPSAASDFAPDNASSSSSHGKSPG